MKILIGCEESQVITKLARQQGHDAFSCDILSTRGNPFWHYKGDIFDAITDKEWDVIILHPPCTALSLSGNRWYGKNMPKHQQRLDAIDWTIKLWDTARQHCDRVALENPASVVFQYLETEDVQYVQPWWFGHGETKRTGFALHGLPRLTATDIVEGREQKIWKMAPGPNRARDRSVTYSGVANAIVEQWFK